MKCTVSILSADKAYFSFDILGGRNYHATIEFEDGKTWLARFRLPNHENPLLQERNFDRCSEFATYRHLARAGIPVPKVYDYANDEDPKNLVGAGYILLEKLSGKPLEWHEASEVQKEWFLRQLADVYVSLEQHSFDIIGRLQLSSNRVPEVGPAFFDYDDSGKLIPFGPFNSSNEYYTALIQQRIKLIESKELASSSPLAQLLVYKTLLDSLPPNETRGFFLRHIDSRDANFLVDDNYNITGIIDWEFAIVTSRSSAFQSPLLLYNLGELNHQGLSTPSKDEKQLSRILQQKGQVKLAALAEQKLHFRVELVLEADPLALERFKRMFSGWWKVAYGMGVFDWDEWYKEAREKYGDGSL